MTLLNDLTRPVPDSGAIARTAASDPLWRHSGATWLTDMGVLAGLGLAFLVIAWWRLERLRPGRRARL